MRFRTLLQLIRIALKPRQKEVGDSGYTDHYPGLEMLKLNPGKGIEQRFPLAPECPEGPLNPDPRAIAAQTFIKEKP